MNIEEKQSVINRLLKGKETSFVEKYIADGPTKVKEGIGASDEEWSVIFDYMVFEENLLYKAVTINIDFFLDIYVKHGSAHVKEVLDITHMKYDIIWEILFDYIAVSHDGLYFHVMEHRDKYTTAMKARGGDFVRKVLGVWKPKYEGSWAKVLDFLLHAVCDAIFSEQTYENSIKAFSLIMNGVREHRPIYKHGLL